MRLFLFFTTLLVTHVVLATTAPSQKINSIRDDYEEARTDLVESEISERALLAELFKIKKKMKEIEKERGILDMKKSSARENITSLNSILGSLNRKVQRQKSMVRQRIRAIYKFGGKGLMRLAFMSENPAALDQNLRVLRMITERDYRSLDNYKANIRVLKQKRRHLDLENDELRKVNQRIQARIRMVESEKRKKEKLLNSLKAQSVLKMAKLKRIKIRSRAIQSSLDTKQLRLLDEILDPAFFELRGKLRWPVSGEVLQDFGEQLMEDDGIHLNQEGLFLSAKPGEKVRSVFQGKVEYVGVIPLYGRTVIVSHGDRYNSVYSNLGNITKKTGDKVDVGEVIAEPALSFDGVVGISFQIRHFSDPKDPKEWLQAKK